MIDQFVHDPGNLSVLADHLGSPPEPAVGLGQGIELALLHLDVLGFVGDGGSGATGSLVDASSDPEGSIVPGVVALVVWGAAAAWTIVRRRGLPDARRPPRRGGERRSRSASCR